MRHILDSILIKFLFLMITIFFLYIFRKIHIFLAPKDVRNFHLKFYPVRNHTDSLHFFSRLLSIAIILSSLSIEVHPDLVSNLMHFISWSGISVATYFASIYILEGIILHPFDYFEEIHNKKNYSYVIISSVLSICTAFLIKTTIAQTGFYFLLSSVTYAFLFVVFMMLLKLYHFTSVFHLKSYIAKKDLSVALSYSGYIIAMTTLCVFAQEDSSASYQVHLLTIMSKIIWAILLFPIFKYSIVFIFKVQHKENQDKASSIGSAKLGYGIFEGATFCMASIFTALLMPAINMTTALPIFNSSPSL